MCPADSFDEATADMISDGVVDLFQQLIKTYYEKDETKKVLRKLIPTYRACQALLQRLQISLSFSLNRFCKALRAILGSLSNDVFERRASTGSELFAMLGRDF